MTIGDLARRTSDFSCAANIVPGRPRSSDLMRALAELESTFPTQEWRVDHLPVWPLVRLRWFFGEWAVHYASAPLPDLPSSGAVRYAKRALAGAVAAASVHWRDRRANDRGPDRRDIIYLSDGLSFSRLGDRWVERFCDPLIAVAGHIGLSSSLWTPLHHYHEPRFTPSCFVQCAIDRANMAGALRALGAAGSARLPAQTEIVDWMAKRGFGVATLQTTKIVSDACRVRAVANLYRHRLERARPRVAFIVSFYSVEGMAFVLACRECGIPVVDIQHGVQGEMHPAYAAWPRPQCGLHPLLPDHFWVWSDWEADVVARWSRGTGHSVVVGGNPWTDVWRAGSSWEGVSDALIRAQALKYQAGGRSVILVTLQYGLGPAEQLEGLAELLRAAGEPLVFWVRLHPAMLERREEIRGYLANAGPCELDECTDLPLQALLPYTDAHLTHSSTTVIDAAQFGVCSVITAGYGAELFAPFLATGIAHVETGGSAGVQLTLARLALAGRRQPRAAPSIETAFSKLLAEARSARGID